MTTVFNWTSGFTTVPQSNVYLVSLGNMVMASISATSGTVSATGLPTAPANSIPVGWQPLYTVQHTFIPGTNNGGTTAVHLFFLNDGTVRLRSTAAGGFLAQNAVWRFDTTFVTWTI